MLSKNVILTTVFALGLTYSPQGISQQPATTKPAGQVKPTPGVLHPADLDGLIPPSVFFKGQSATVQLRNSGGVRFADGAIMFVIKVDTGGYSTSIQERYQDYLVSAKFLCALATPLARRRSPRVPTESALRPPTASL